jgi:hypothetical protein
MLVARIFCIIANKHAGITEALVHLI